MQVSGLATLLIYILAGIPQFVSLCFSLSVGHVDTHVLMTLAVFGTLAIGGALEVRPGPISPLGTAPAPSQIVLIKSGGGG
jgi:cation transport ATPase